MLVSQHGLYLKAGWRPYPTHTHNPDAENASQEVAELLRDGLPAFTVDQRSRHTRVDPDECSACRAGVAQSVNPVANL